MSNPATKNDVPTESSGVIVLGAPCWCEWRGELMIITGSDTTNTQVAYDGGNLLIMK